MDTIEKALNKHRQRQEAELENDSVTASEDPPVTVIEQAAAEVDIPVVRGAGQSASSASYVNTEHVLEIDLAELERMGAILPDDARSKIKEEYKHIKRPLLQKALTRTDPRSADNLIMITSPLSGEGKTFSSLNLALSIAVERDCRVLLIDADVVKPGLGRALAVDDYLGLVEYLNGEVDCLSDILLSTNINNLTVLPSGKTHHLSHELLASNAMRELVNELSSRYSDRIIIFDSPPILVTSEAEVLSDLVGQITLVVEQDKTSQQAVKEALTKLDSSKVSGLILNKSHVLGEGYYGYYGYYYSK